VIYWPWLVVTFLAGLVVAALARGVSSLPRAPKPPEPPRCPAVIQSGEVCTKPAGHEGPHRAYIAGGLYGQEYLWEDERNGLHSRGFYYR
jgi:hypothetical protein